jgi:hypothetical protein
LFFDGIFHLYRKSFYFKRNRIARAAFQPGHHQRSFAMVSVLACAVRRTLGAAALFGALTLPAAAGSAPPVVSPQWLKQHPSDPDLVVLDIRSVIEGGGADAYAKAHITGAVHSD